MNKNKILNNRTYLEVSSSIIKSNAESIREYIGNNTKLMSILKADAYGVGIEETAKAINNLSDWFGVATPEEAFKIRNQGISTPILVLGYVLDEYIEKIIDLDITLCTISLGYVKHLNSLIPKGKNLNVHIKIDTGLNRIGLYSKNHNIDDFITQIEEIYKFDNINVTGIYTHFASAGSFKPNDVEFTQHQYETFVSVCKRAQKLGYDLGIKHCCNSNAMVYNPDKYLDMVRVGKFLFGYGQNKEINKLGIDLAFRLKARIVNLKTIEQNESVGYDRAFTANHKMKIATISFGYADGYRKNQSMETEVIINGKRAKIVGNIAMDYFMVDVSGHYDVKVGDYVTLIGKDGKEIIMPNENAQIINASTPEFNTQIGNRVYKTFIN